MCSAHSFDVPLDSKLDGYSFFQGLQWMSFYEWHHSKEPGSLIHRPGGHLELFYRSFYLCFFTLCPILGWKISWSLMQRVWVTLWQFKSFTTRHSQGSIYIGAGISCWALGLLQQATAIPGPAKPCPIIYCSVYVLGVLGRWVHALQCEGSQGTGRFKWGVLAAGRFTSMCIPGLN